jgi:hypothetical protein
MCHFHFRFLMLPIEGKMRALFVLFTAEYKDHIQAKLLVVPRI